MCTLTSNYYFVTLLKDRFLGHYSSNEYLSSCHSNYLRVECCLFPRRPLSSHHPNLVLVVSQISKQLLAWWRRVQVWWLSIEVGCTLESRRHSDRREAQWSNCMRNFQLHCRTWRASRPSSWAARNHDVAVMTSYTLALCVANLEDSPHRWPVMLSYDFFLCC